MLCNTVNVMSYEYSYEYSEFMSFERSFISHTPRQAKTDHVQMRCVYGGRYAQEMGQNQAASQADRRAICGTGQTRQRTCRAAATGKELSEGIIRLHMPEEEDIKCIILTAH